ncbi:MAG: DMT family transporter [Planctomycetaceae bacterium]
MGSLALTLVIISAFIHATWNLMAKRAAGGWMFVWLFTGCSSLLLVPIAVTYTVIVQPDLDLRDVSFIVGTAVIHLLYFLLLQRAYALGDLSLIYPLARGSGPTLATVGAVLLLGEQPSPLTWLGLVLVVGGVVVLALPAVGFDKQNLRPGLVYGLLTGCCIASYTVWDKYAVDQLSISPLLMEAATGLGVCLMLTPSALARRAEVRAIWSAHRNNVLGVAILSPTAYLLILVAMSFTDLSSIAPAREISILIAAILGTRFLGEAQTARRLAAAAAMVCGLLALACG